MLAGAQRGIRLALRCCPLRRDRLSAEQYNVVKRSHGYSVTPLFISVLAAGCSSVRACPACPACPPRCRRVLYPFLDAGGACPSLARAPAGQRAPPAAGCTRCAAHAMPFAFVRG